MRRLEKIEVPNYGVTVGGAVRAVPKRYHIILWLAIYYIFGVVFCQSCAKKSFHPLLGSEPQIRHDSIMIHPLQTSKQLTPWRFCPKLWQHRQWRRYVSVKGSWISCVSILLSTTIIAHLPTLLEFTIATVLCWHPIYDLRHHSDVPGYLHGASCGTFPWWSSSCGGWRNEHVVSGARIFRLNYACREVADCTWGTRKLSSNLRKGKGIC